MKKITIPSFRQKKKDAQKVTMITVYDYVFARLVEASDAEMILVGDSLGMVIQGQQNTLAVTVDDIIYHCRAVGRSIRRAHTAADPAIPHRPRAGPGHQTPLLHAGRPRRATATR